MLISPAYAQDANAAFATITQFLPLVLIFGVFYFMLIRPQQTRQKQMRAMLATLKRGDKVVTAGGILGTVQKVRDGSDEIEVDIAPNVRVTVMRDTISAVIAPQVANDTAKPAKAGSTRKLPPPFRGRAGERVLHARNTVRTWTTR